MNVSSLSPWLLDFHTVWFSGSSGWFLFLTWMCEETKHIYYASISARTPFSYKKWLIILWELWWQQVGKVGPLEYFLIFIYLFLERGERMEKERERNINVWLHLACLPLGTWPATQACALTGNWTGNPLVCEPSFNPLSHTKQGIFLNIYSNKKKCKSGSHLWKNLHLLFQVGVVTWPRFIGSMNLFFSNTKGKIICWWGEINKLFQQNNIDCIFF